MSNKDLFINGYLSKIMEKFSINKDDAFEIFSIAAVLDQPFQDIYNDIIIQGNKDGGIDGIYFQQLSDFYIMHVFQCKNSKSLRANQIDKFRNDYNDVFRFGNSVGKPNTEDLDPKISEYRNLSLSGFVIEERLYFLYNGENNDPDKGANAQIYNSYHDIDKGFEIWDSDALYNKVSSLIKIQKQRSNTRFVFKPENSNVVLRDSQAIYSYSIQNVRAVNFRIKAIDLCELVENELTANSTYDFLFSDNIRGYLGMRARANKKMSQTLDDSNDAIYFPFLNNGITIICEKLTLPNGPQEQKYLVPSYNPVIVNGLQTTRVIYSKYKEDPQKINGIFINVRLYETDDPILIDKITDATNTQTPINFRDKVSNKDFNSWAKEIFELNKIAYITKRGETFSNKLSKDGNESIHSDTIIKYWFATFFEKPEVAKNSISSVLETVYDATNTNNPLNKLFNGNKDSVIYKQFLNTYKIYQRVQKEKIIRKGTKEFLPYADELLAYGSYKYIETKLENIDDENELGIAYEKAFQTINNIVKNNIDQHKKANKNFSYPSYFKKPKCKVDFNNESNIIEEDDLINYLLKI